MPFAPDQRQVAADTSDVKELKGAANYCMYL